MKPLAKPGGITLADHTRHVKQEAKSILDTWTFLRRKYERLTGNELGPLVAAAVSWHDQGKQHPIWQTACRADYELFQNWCRENGHPTGVVDRQVHKQYEHAIRKAGNSPAPHLFKAGLRHEMASLERITAHGRQLSPEVRVAIAAHHSKLSQRHARRWRNDGGKKDGQPGPFYTYFEEFLRFDNRVREKNGWKDMVLARYRFDVVRAVLQLADTRASRLESEGTEAMVDLARFPLVVPFPTLRPVQEKALAIAEEPISILRAPTGSGKTHAAMLWAQRQIREFDRADRLVIAMPTRFTANALAIASEKNLGETGLYHSSAWFTKFGSVEQGLATSIATEKHRMAKYLANPVTVCTIDHILASLTGTLEAHHITFSLLAHSCVVIDEADFYDPFVQANIVALLEVLRILNVPVLIMSATVPNSALDLYKLNGEIHSAPEVIPSEKEKVEKRIIYRGESEKPEDVTDILADMLAAKQGIIYANTVARALAYYYYLRDQPECKEVPLILYHSRFTEPDKKAIENRLVAALGKYAWEGNQANGIAILTQIGEMSINISSAYMLSDLCPWDRLAQRIGRLGRFFESRFVRCYVVKPTRNEKFYPAPYGEKPTPRSEWIPYPALLATGSRIAEYPKDGKVVDPNYLTQRVNELYPDSTIPEGSATANQRNLKALMRDTWIILPDQNTETDGERQAGHLEWRSRDIPAQAVVFTQDIPRFSSWRQYQEHQLKYAVSCPFYLIEIDQRKSADQQTIQIFNRPLGTRDDVENIPIYYTARYSSRTGLPELYGFPYVNEDDQHEW